MIVLERDGEVTVGFVCVHGKRSEFRIYDYVNLIVKILVYNDVCFIIKYIANKSLK